ncbi:MAG: 3-deoxy-7-phosphoheptulonate synthase [Planctomycetota bacterium]
MSSSPAVCTAIAPGPLPLPAALQCEYPLDPAAAALIARSRAAVRAILSGHDPRLLVVVGPCSIHDPEAALDYADRLAAMAQGHRQELLVVMRTYFEKPRTRIGWKGLINDPHRDGSCDIVTGLRRARRVLTGVAERGLPAASELLDPLIAPYLTDGLSWAAIGARTVESQPHRCLASDLPLPVGLKNSTDGNLATAIDAALTAMRPHTVLAPGTDGRPAVRRTQGNPDVHLVLRGGRQSPNHDPATVRTATAAAHAAGLRTGLMIDCSHANAAKDPVRQAQLVRALCTRIATGDAAPHAVMIESNIIAGNQDPAHMPLVYGRSITDPCIDMATTGDLLAQLARSVRIRGECRRTDPAGEPVLHSG